MGSYLNLGERLVRQGMISADDLKRITRLQEEQQTTLVRLVVELGFVSEDDLLPVLSEHLGIPCVSLKNVPVTPLSASGLVSAAEFLKMARIAPIKVEGDELQLAITDPTDLSRFQAIELATGLRVRPFLAKEKEILAHIGFEADQETPEDGSNHAVAGYEADVMGDEEDVEYLRDMASEVPVIRVVNQMIARALESRASDIHIEPYESEIKIRYRIDGILHDVESPPRQMKAAIISRFKILAQLNIAERRLPQDGRFKVRVAGKDVDLRISTVPTLYGESVVVRLLDRSQIFTDLDALGFPVETLHRFVAMITKPHGMVLVTGPTGSGKTTTLYGALQKIHDPTKKIITIEDPVEYQLPGVNQIQVKPQIGLTFANGLRSIVRQDPDIIMVGEIRDFETAEIAVQAALTGHLVLSTLHTNDAPGAVSRLLEMGVQDYLLASSLLGVLAQRLVRRLCLQCCEEAPCDGADWTGWAEPPPHLWRARGCEACSRTGFSGRIGIFELLPMTPAISQLIVEHADSGKVRNKARSHGMTLLKQDGWNKAREGVTTLEEVLRVTREEG